MAIVPKILKNFDLFINGVGHAGNVEEVTLPTLTIQEEEHRAGGMDMPIALDMGMEKMELSFKLAEQTADLFKSFGLVDQSPLRATFRGARQDDSVTESFVVTVRGSLMSLNMGSMTAGEKNMGEYTMTLRYLRVEIGGVTLVEIDTENMIRKINGVDQLERIRQAISG